MDTGEWIDLENTIARVDRDTTKGEDDPRTRHATFGSPTLSYAISVGRTRCVISSRPRLTPPLSLLPFSVQSDEYERVDVNDQ